MDAERPVAELQRLQQAGWLSVLLVLLVSLYASFAQPPAVATCWRTPQTQVATLRFFLRWIPGISI